MAFKIVNGKLVRITSQSDFGTPAQKAAGQRITGTLGNITTSTAPRTTSTPQKITLGSSAPTVAAPVVPTISAGSNVQQAIQQQATQNQIASTISGFQAANAPPSLPFGPPLPPTPFRTTDSTTTPVVSFTGAPAQEAQISAASLTGANNVQVAEPVAPRGTLGLGLPRRVTDRTQLAVPSLAGEIVTGAQLREQNRLKTLNNPRTVGEFEALGLLPQIQAMRDAFFRGEPVNDVWIRFMLNQGLITEDDLFGLDLDAGGVGFGGGGGGGGGTSLGPRTQTQFPGDRVPGRSFSSMGLGNWRI